MAAGKRAGLVDVKVVSFSDTLTAEKFVIPVAKRPGRAAPAGDRQDAPLGGRRPHRGGDPARKRTRESRTARRTR